MSRRDLSGCTQWEHGPLGFGARNGGSSVCQHKARMSARSPPRCDGNSARGTRACSTVMRSGAMSSILSRVPAPSSGATIHASARSTTPTGKMCSRCSRPRKPICHPRPVSRRRPPVDPDDAPGVAHLERVAQAVQRADVRQCTAHVLHPRATPRVRAGATLASEAGLADVPSGPAARRTCRSAGWRPSRRTRGPARRRTPARRHASTARRPAGAARRASRQPAARAPTCPTRGRGRTR